MSTVEKLLPGDRDISLSEIHALTGPTVLWFLVFLLVPLSVVFVYSFLSYESFSVVWEFTLDPYTETVLSDTIISATVLTVGIGLVVTVITLLFGYPIAYFLRFSLSEKAGILLLLFLVIPFWTSGVVRTLGWLPILGQTGVINKVLLWIGVIDQPLEVLLYSPLAMAIGYLQNYVVFMASPIYISLSQIDEDLLDASETLRGNPVETFRHVTLPLSLPGVAIGCMFTFVLTIGNFSVPNFLSGGQGTITTLIYSSVNRGLRYPDAAAMSIMLLLLIFIFVYALLRTVDITKIAQG
ncbi:ABC transporter permease [Halorientalis pallida]|uniref:ABC transporter permease n=1 Tax=Halorientalis pallida TaxID=2479928 RepID=A0A498KUD1_9EURY|nr:ABC transporter permease [Halorientalis pallida]RXK47925.1 ABC transporter permease [Halorientalis pallida]